MQPKGLLNTVTLCMILVVLVLSAGQVLPASQAQEYPNKPITMIVGFAAGGVTDLPARKLAELASKYLNNQPIIVENKVGGAGTIAAVSLSKANPDGYTISAVTFSSLVLIPHMRKVAYDTKKDFEYILQVAEYAQPFCVRKDHPANSWKEWLEWAKKNVDKATYCTSGPGSGPHVFMQEIFNIEKIKPFHIPFGGGIECVTAVLGGNVNAVLDSATVPHIKSGQFKAFAVEPEERISSLPNVPTFKELGYGTVRAPLWLGLGAPGKLAAPILKKLEEAFTKAAKEPAFREMMEKMGGMEVVVKNSAAFRKIVESDYDYYAVAIKKLGIKAQ